MLLARVSYHYVRVVCYWIRVTQRVITYLVRITCLFRTARVYCARTRRYACEWISGGPTYGVFEISDSNDNLETTSGSLYLPPEMLSRVLSHLPYAQLVPMRLVNRAFKQEANFLFRKGLEELSHRIRKWLEKEVDRVPEEPLARLTLRYVWCCQLLYLPAVLRYKLISDLWIVVQDLALTYKGPLEDGEPCLIFGQILDECNALFYESSNEEFKYPFYQSYLYHKLRNWIKLQDLQIRVQRAKGQLRSEAASCRIPFRHRMKRRWAQNDREVFEVHREQHRRMEQVVRACEEQHGKPFHPPLLRFEF